MGHAEEVAECEQWLKEQGYVRKPEKKKPGCLTYFTVGLFLALIFVIFIL